MKRRALWSALNFVTVLCAVYGSGQASPSPQPIPNAPFVAASYQDITKAWPPLVDAAWQGKLDKVQSLLAAGADPNVASKADPNVASEEGVTPLMAAASWEQYDAFEGGKEERHIRIIDLLLSRGANIEAQDKEGMTALTCACAFGHAKTALRLLDAGANINSADKKGRTALTWAAPSGVKDRSLVQPLLKRGARVRLIDALLLEAIPSAHSLVDSADLTARGPRNETALMLAAREGELPLVQTLLRRGEQVNAADDNGNTALMMANGSILSNSMGLGTRIWEEFGEKPGRAEIMEALLAAGAKPDLRNKKGETALHWASELGYTDLARVLLNHHADPNVQMEHGGTPLKRAIEAGNLPMATLLLENRANPNSEDTPLIAAMGRNPQPQMIDLLLKHGADINLMQGGRSVFMEAAHEGTAATVELLLAKGAKINAVDSLGDTALFLAAGWNTDDVVEALLKGGADVFHKNPDKQTALDIAVKQKRTKNATLLKRAMKNRAPKK